jgi:hypothetical protein
LFERSPKFIHRNSEGFIGLVVLLNKIHVGLEDLISVLEFVMAVALSILLHPEGEKQIDTHNR